MAIEGEEQIPQSQLTGVVSDIQHRYAQAGPSAVSIRDEVEIRYPNGVRLSIHSQSGIDSDLLRSLVRLP